MKFYTEQVIKFAVLAQNRPYLPQVICVTTLPISSKTFLGFISWLVEL